MGSAVGFLVLDVFDDECCYQVVHMLMMARGREVALGNGRVGRANQFHQP